MDQTNENPTFDLSNPSNVAQALELLYQQIQATNKQLLETNQRNQDLESRLANQKKHVVPPPVKVFKGEKKDRNLQVVSSWLNVWNKYFAMNQFPESEKLSTVTMFLEGRALVWWDDLVAKGNQPCTWDDFCKLFRDYFLPLLDDYEHFQKLSHLTMNKGLEQFIQDFHEYLNPLYSDIPPKVQMLMFIDGLPKDYQVDVRRNHPKTLEDAIRAAKYFDDTPKPPRGQ